jgi:hypothetical protein
VPAWSYRARVIRGVRPLRESFRICEEVAPDAADDLSTSARSDSRCCRRPPLDPPPTHIIPRTRCAHPKRLFRVTPLATARNPPATRSVVASSLLGLVLAAASALPLAGPQLLRAFIDTAIAGGAVWALVVDRRRLRAARDRRPDRDGGNHLRGEPRRVDGHERAARAGHTPRSRPRPRVPPPRLPGTLIERVDGDATAIAKFFTDFAVKVIGAGLMLGGVVVLVSLEDWRHRHRRSRCSRPCRWP